MPRVTCEVFRALGFSTDSLSIGNRSYLPQFMMASSMTIPSVANAMGKTHMKMNAI